MLEKQEYAIVALDNTIWGSIVHGIRLKFTIVSAIILVAILRNLNHHFRNVTSLTKARPWIFSLPLATIVSVGLLTTRHQP